MQFLETVKISSTMQMLNTKKIGRYSYLYQVLPSSFQHPLPMIWRCWRRYWSTPPDSMMLFQDFPEQNPVFPVNPFLFSPLDGIYPARHPVFARWPWSWLSITDLGQAWFLARLLTINTFSWSILRRNKTKTISCIFQLFY